VLLADENNVLSLRKTPLQGSTGIAEINHIGERLIETRRIEFPDEVLLKLVASLISPIERPIF